MEESGLVNHLTSQERKRERKMTGESKEQWKKKWVRLCVSSEILKIWGRRCVIGGYWCA